MFSIRSQRPLNSLCLLNWGDGFPDNGEHKKANEHVIGFMEHQMACVLIKND